VHLGENGERGTHVDELELDHQRRRARAHLEPVAAASKGVVLPNRERGHLPNAHSEHRKVDPNGHVAPPHNEVHEVIRTADVPPVHHVPAARHHLPGRHHVGANRRVRRDLVHAGGSAVRVALPGEAADEVHAARAPLPHRELPRLCGARDLAAPRLPRRLVAARLGRRLAPRPVFAGHRGPFEHSTVSSRANVLKARRYGVLAAAAAAPSAQAHTLHHEAVPESAALTARREPPLAGLQRLLPGDGIREHRLRVREGYHSSSRCHGFALQLGQRKIRNEKPEIRNEDLTGSPPTNISSNFVRVGPQHMIATCSRCS